MYNLCTPRSSIIKSSNSKGFSLVETMCALSLISILTGMGVYSYIDHGKSTMHSAKELTSFLRSLRSRALVSTRALKFQPTASGTVRVSEANSCGGIFTEITNTNFKLPTGTGFSSLSWEYCFSSKGNLDNAGEIQISDGVEVRTIELSLSGGVKFR
jgi:prepilin-type N-terminal cleavage/methylation domain-containing protein